MKGAFKKLGEMGLFQCFPLNEQKLMIYLHGGNLSKFSPTCLLLHPGSMTTNVPQDPTHPLCLSILCCWKFRSQAKAGLLFSVDGQNQGGAGSSYVRYILA